MKVNKQRPRLIFIYGIPAVGKLTVAQELSRITKYKVLHNHMVFDFVFKLFKWNTREGQAMREKVYFDITKELMKSSINVIYTHAHICNYKYPFGMTSDAFIKKLKQITEKAGGIFCPVYLTAEKNVLMKRVTHPSRKKFTKTNTKKAMQEWIDSDRIKSPHFSKNTFVLDNTNLSPKKAADAVQKHFNL